jgi:preprotein translocase subunit YajC
MDLSGTSLVLAQDAPPRDPGERPAPGLLENPIFLIAFVFIFVYFFLIRPQKREQDEKQRMLDALKKNDRVVTTGGIFGTVVNVKDDEVVLRVDDQAKVKIRFLKGAIARVVQQDATTPETTEEASKS